MLDKFITCSQERWKEAQEWELNAWLGSEKNLEDWNSWWFNHFQNFNYLQAKSFKSLLEVGCGPYCRNTEYFMKLFPSITTVSVLDPLLDDYTKHEYYVTTVVKRYGARMFSCALEDYSDDNKYDAILCINVLDHVKDANACMGKMFDALNKDGVLILGQDLTCDEDFKSDPGLLTDPGIQSDWIIFISGINSNPTITFSIIYCQENWVEIQKLIMVLCFMWVARSENNFWHTTL